MNTVGEIFKEAFSDFGSKSKGVLGQSPASIERREQAFSLLTNTTLPTRKQDDWRYQSLRPLQDYKKAAGFAEGLSVEKIEDLSQLLKCFKFDEKLIFNGLKYAGEEVGEFSCLPSKNEHDIFLGEAERNFSTALATSFALKHQSYRFSKKDFQQTILFARKFTEDGVTGEVLHVEIENGAKVRFVIVQDFRDESDNAFFSDWTFKVHPDAHVEIVKLQIGRTESQDCKIENWQIQVLENASVSVFALDVAGRVSKFKCDVKLSGPRAKCHVGAVGFVSGEQKHQNDILVHHKAELTESTQKFFQVGEKGGVSIFNGVVRIDRDCVGSAGQQLSRSYLKDNDSQAYARPELWIDCDDVKCKHGASTIRVSEDEVFYLQSRGIRREDAVAILEKSFLDRSFSEAAPWLNQIERESLKKVGMKS